MARRSKHEYLRVMWQRDQRASRRERSALLDDVTRVCRYHRKDASGLLSRPTPPKPPVRRVTRRRPTYGEAVSRLLAQVWEASGSRCGQRVKAAIPHWLPWLTRRAAVTPAQDAPRRRISSRQIDRRLRERKQRIKRRLDGTTRPGARLKHQIPIKTDHWDGRKAGSLESDRVSHAGASAAGALLHTLDGVDMHTTWVERQAVMGKSRQAVVQAMHTIEHQLPFPLRGVDADNGSEFINDHLWAFCTERPTALRVQFTRSRPDKKEDHAHVEQKNWTHVRKLVGWERYDSPEALVALNTLSADLRLFQNLFQPSMQLVRKVRVGSRLIRRDEAPQTPVERVRACPEADPTKIAAWQRILETTDPFVLSRRIDQHLERLWALAARARPGAAGPSAHAFGSRSGVMGRIQRPAGGDSSSAHRAIAPDKANMEADFPAGSLKTPQIGRGAPGAR